MRQIAVSVLVVALFVPVSRPAASQVTGTVAPPSTVVGKTAVTTTTTKAGEANIHGTAVTPGGQPLANTTVQARDLLTAQIEGSTKTATTGQFSISLKPGNYVLELVDDAGQIIGTSSFISGVAGASVAVTLTAASGALSAASAATGLLGILGGAAARNVGLAAAAAGVTAAVPPKSTPTASPSR